MSDRLKAHPRRGEPSFSFNGWVGHNGLVGEFAGVYAHFNGGEADQNLMDLASVQALLGHKDLDSTMKYLAPLGKEAMLAKVESVWG
jgi:hypothetical protein